VKHPIFFDLTQPAAASSHRKPASAGTSCDSCCGQDNENKGTLFQCVLQEGHFVVTLVNFWLRGRIKVIFNFPATIGFSVKSVFSGLCNLLIRFVLFTIQSTNLYKLKPFIDLLCIYYRLFNLAYNSPRCRQHPVYEHFPTLS